MTEILLAAGIFGHSKHQAAQLYISQWIGLVFYQIPNISAVSDFYLHLA